MKTTFTFLLLMLCSSIYSQQQLKGIVTDSENNPVFAANVYLLSNPQAGVTTDFDGKFALPYKKAVSKDTLIISFIGYQAYKMIFDTSSIQNPLNIKLKQDNKTLQEVNIVAKEPISEQFSVTKLEALDIYLNPISNGDPLKAITALPASTTTDESANPSLRGSYGDRSRVVVNGVPVYRPVRNSQVDGVGHFSLFNTEIIYKQYVYASNPPLTYGNTSAGLVEIETIDALEQNSLSLSAGLAHGGVFLSQKFKENSFLQAYTNIQYSDAFMNVNKGNMPNLKGFSSKDAGINFHTKLGEKLSFNLFSYGIFEDYHVNFNYFTYKGDALGDKKRNFNIINFKYNLKNGFLSINNGTNFSETSYQFGNIFSNNTRRQVYTSVNYKQIINEKFSFQTGVMYDLSMDKFNDSVSVNYYALSPVSENYFIKSNTENELAEAFFYSSYHLSDKILLSGGIRKNIPIDNRDSYLSTQLGVKYHITSRQNILFSGGVYHNYSVPNYFMNNYELLECQQLAIDYSLNINKLNFNAALFYKDEYGKQINSNYHTINNVITKGAEIYFDYYFAKSLKLTFANTFLDQNVEVEGDIYKGEKDLDYFIKTTLAYNNPKLFTAAITFIGRPGMHYTSVNNSRYDPVSGFYQPFFSHEFNNSQYSNYNNISINFSKYIQFYKHTVVFYASCNNLLNFENQSNPVYNQDYSSRTFNHYQFRTIYFGMMWQIGY